MTTEVLALVGSVAAFVNAGVGSFWVKEILDATTERPSVTLTPLALEKRRQQLDGLVAVARVLQWLTVAVILLLAVAAVVSQVDRGHDIWTWHGTTLVVVALAWLGGGVWFIERCGRVHRHRALIDAFNEEVRLPPEERSAAAPWRRYTTCSIFATRTGLR